MARILLMTQLFDPENAIKGLSFAKGLSKLGHKVEVITTFPSYPGGKIYSGYHMRWCQIENHGDVRVVRIPSYIAHGKSASKRLASYASFSLAAFLYSLFFAKRPDVIYAYYPPMLCGIFAALMSILLRRPFVYDVQDLWPEALVATKMLQSNNAVMAVDKIISWIYARSSAIVVLSDGYKRLLVNKGVPKEKIFRIYNWCDESRLFVEDATVTEDDLDKFFDIVYAGNLGAAQALHYVLAAADIVWQAGYQQIRFVFFGDGIESGCLKKIVKERKLQNVIFKGHVQPELMGPSLRKAETLLVHLADDPLFEITIPSKTQAYLALGRPILMAVKGESAEIVSQAGAGIVAKPCNAESIAEAAICLFESSTEQLRIFGKCAEEFYRASMSQKNGIEQVSNIVHTICRSGA